MNMKAKHYQLIAIALAGVEPAARTHSPSAANHAHFQWERDCRAICDALAMENPVKFERNRFLQLCGVLS